MESFDSDASAASADDLVPLNADEEDGEAEAEKEDSEAETMVMETPA